MKKFYLSVGFLFVSSLCIEVPAQKTALTRFLQSDLLKHASVGIQVIDVSDGKSICSYNHNQSLSPASCMKTVTTASALEKLGADFTYTTAVFTDGLIDQQGNLNGNIYIKGSGDPTLGSEYSGNNRFGFLNEWLTGIRNAGIKSVTGSIIALDDLFGYEGVSPDWPWADMGNYYAPGIYGISIFDNTYRLYLKSGAVGTTPEILKTEPEISFLRFENHLTAAVNNIDSAYIYGMPFSSERRLYGTIPQNKNSFVIKGDIPDPGTFLAEYFTAFLRKNGIIVAKEASSSRLTQTTPKQVKVLATTISSPLSVIIRTINFQSNNHYAEHLFRKMKHDYQSESEVINYWKKQGLDTDGLFMYDGSGLSPANGVSATFFTELLAYMNNKSKYQFVFYHSLPLAGKEGSVSNFLKGTVLEGKVRIKSGSIKNVLSYCGYVDLNGKRYAFAVIVNKYTGSRNLLRNQMEQLLLDVMVR